MTTTLRASDKEMHLGKGASKSDVSILPGSFVGGN